MSEDSEVLGSGLLDRSREQVQNEIDGIHPEARGKTVSKIMVMWVWNFTWFGFIREHIARRTPQVQISMSRVLFARRTCVVNVC